uniref:Uncharacterized protein n=1 Tax=Moniliophthora roreri TaxID=221103 RepID=A0A0W0F2N9_MONRR
MAPSSMFPDTRDNDTTYNSMKAVVDRLRLDTKGTCGHHEFYFLIWNLLAFFPNPSPDYATSRTPGIISSITSILIATQMPPHNTDMQVIYRELDDASRSLNRRLQTLALLALSVYDSQCEVQSNPYVGAKFRGLALESCGAVFTIIVAAKRIQAGENSHDDTLPISDREANELQEKLHYINLCARDLTARGPLEAIIWFMLDLVQIREYRAFMRKIIVDERFCPQVSHLASRERIMERQTSNTASSDDRTPDSPLERGPDTVQESQENVLEEDTTSFDETYGSQTLISNQGNTQNNVNNTSIYNINTVNNNINIVVYTEDRGIVGSSMEA